MELGITIRQLFFHFRFPFEFDALGHACASSGKSLFAVLDDELRTRFRLIGHQVLFNRQVTVAMSVRIGAVIRHVGKQVPLIIVWTKFALILLQCVHLKHK